MNIPVYCEIVPVREDDVRAARRLVEEVFECLGAVVSVVSFLSPRQLPQGSRIWSRRTVRHHVLKKVIENTLTNYRGTQTRGAGREKSHVVAAFALAWHCSASHVRAHPTLLPSMFTEPYTDYGGVCAMAAATAHRRSEMVASGSGHRMCRSTGRGDVVGASAFALAAEAWMSIPPPSSE
jgi:hypothetical protein